ncbi:hypothetical protein F8M41_013712 [Gigaspora margarita]|uniref:F-box domain-containing protein n=1 Tax=Gigaspora margarita TaxID=4874 RepID=A0A8H4A0B0_GIGMA|nr:hypothetical protein F8M41_013712 [Gigaspora margarita]
MASKMFMGDMPELMENIFNNLNNEFYTLYSCALVSRHWCKMSIPILWKDPFSFKQNPLFISKYFSSLGEDEKFSLKEYGLNVEISKTLFAYAKFLKVFHISDLETKVAKWINLQLVDADSKSDSDYVQLVQHIIDLLFKLFVESGASLHKLDLLYFYHEINPEIFNSLEQNVQFFSRLQNLSLNITPYFGIETTTTFLKIFGKNTTKISNLELHRCFQFYDPQLFHALIKVIKSQEQLRKFRLSHSIEDKSSMEFHGIISALESQKDSLQEIVIEKCDYSAEFEIMKNCKQLEIFRIWNCDYSKLLKMLNNKINTLEIVDSQINTLTIVQSLEKFGISLQRLKLESGNEGIRDEFLLFEALKSFCPNITYLSISKIKFSIQFLDLIGKNLQNLQFLTLCYVDWPDNEQVMQFAKKLPLTLQYLNLRNFLLSSKIDILLNHCNAPLKKLLIHHLGRANTKALIEFCIRIKTLNYVGVYREKYLKLEDNIRKEVEEYVKLAPYEHIIVNC